jgi:hypothetical protein
VEEMFLITVFGLLIANSPSYVLIRDFKERVKEENQVHSSLEKTNNDKN